MLDIARRVQIARVSEGDGLDEDSAIRWPMKRSDVTSARTHFAVAARHTRLTSTFANRMAQFTQTRPSNGESLSPVCNIN